MSKDGTLAGIIWRVGTPMMVGSPEMARKERERALAEPKMSAGWVILAVDVEVAGTVEEPVPAKKEQALPLVPEQGGGT